MKDLLGDSAFGIGCQLLPESFQLPFVGFVRLIYLLEIALLDELTSFGRRVFPLLASPAASAPARNRSQRRVSREDFGYPG